MDLFLASHSRFYVLLVSRKQKYINVLQQNSNAGNQKLKKKIKNRDYIAEERKTLQPLRQQNYSLHGVFYDQNSEMPLEECYQNESFH